MIYTGEALKTYNKAHASGNTSKSYIVNKLYTMENGKKYFVNSKGYMHFLMIERFNLPDNTPCYAVRDYMLTKDNMLKDNGIFSRFYDTVNEVKEYLKQLEET